jgi:hypothetical protein
MKYSLFGVFIAGALLAAAPAYSQSSTMTGSTMMAQPAITLPAVRHMVYRFGYNTKATASGTGTGTTTIDIVGVAKDGGMNVTATDNWWNTVNPRQTYSCEVYANGNVKCPQRPNAISPIQVTIVPLLGPHFFKALAGGTHAAWTQNWTVWATLVPAASSGFAGQPTNWNCTASLTGKGTVQNNGKPVVVLDATGSMKQQGGRYVTVDQKSNLLYDPRLKIPVYLAQEIRFVPQRSTARYTVELKLINFSTTPGGST